MGGKDRLERSFYNWLKIVSDVEDDITSLLEGHSIAKSKIAKDIDKMKDRLKTMETTLKFY